MMGAAFCALLVKNSPLAQLYETLLHLPVEIRIGDLSLAKSLYHWVNEGLMVFFFLLIGLEVKRELIEGHLSTPGLRVLPGLAALGGMAVPAMIYLSINAGDPLAIKGWAIPTATDIPFALGVVALLGPRVPTSLKAFLMALAIIDDIGAVIIIAVFYAGDLAWANLVIAAVALAILFVLNRLHIRRLAAYFLVGTILWVGVLKSGVHATLAGVLIALTIPFSLNGGRDGHSVSPAKELEQALHGWVAYLVLPLFAFMNAGVDLSRVPLTTLAEPVPLGIVLGLVLGKQLGVFGFSWAAIRAGWARLPAESDWVTFYGVAVLTGIRFTMSLFINTLAFEEDTLFHRADKLAILVGSLLSGLWGYGVIRLCRAKKPA